jgi:uncharacterized protein
MSIHQTFSDSISRRGFFKKSAAAGVGLGIAGLSTGSAQEGEVKKIKALLVIGGGYHDYDAQKKILAEGISKLIDVEFTVWHHVSAEEVKKALSVKGWADPYDVIVYSICHAAETDSAYIDSIVDIHKNGKPCVALHCTLHSYHWKIGKGKESLEDKEWTKLMGVISTSHGPKKAETITKTDVVHESYKPVADGWTTPNGELYDVLKVHPTATVLAWGSNGLKNHPVIWVNKYEKANVFVTSLGHHNETVAAPEYLKTVADGILWVVAEAKKA